MFDCQRVGRMVCINDEDSTMVTFGSNISVLPKKRVMCVLLDSIPPKFWGWHQRGWRYLWGRRTHWDVQFQARSKLVPSHKSQPSARPRDIPSPSSREVTGLLDAAWCWDICKFGSWPRLLDKVAEHQKRGLHIAAVFITTSLICRSSRILNVCINLLVLTTRAVRVVLILIVRVRTAWTKVHFAFQTWDTSRVYQPPEAPDPSVPSVESYDIFWLWTEVYLKGWWPGGCKLSAIEMAAFSWSAVGQRQSCKVPSTSFNHCCNLLHIVALGLVESSQDRDSSLFRSILNFLLGSQRVWHGDSFRAAPRKDHQSSLWRIGFQPDRIPAFEGLWEPESGL